jgi:hypothetical protein
MTVRQSEKQAGKQATAEWSPESLQHRGQHESSTYRSVAIGNSE